jgi:hypothetical protein
MAATGPRTVFIDRLYRSSKVSDRMRFKMRSFPNSLLGFIVAGLLLRGLTIGATLASAQQGPNPSTGTTVGATNIPAGSAGEYIVGEADVLRINVWKQPEISQLSVMVRPDGMVSVPLVGEVRVSGMTPSQIQETLVSELKRYVNEPRVTVAVAEVGSGYNGRCSADYREGRRRDPIRPSEIGFRITASQREETKTAGQLQ